MDLRQIVILVLAISLFLTVLGYGLRATVDDVLYLVHRPGLLVRSALAMFVIVPIAVVLIDRSFNLDPRVEIIMVTLALSPVPPILPKKAGSLSTQGYPLALAATMSLLSIVVVQIGMFILSQFFGRTFSMSPASMVFPIVGIILAPLMVGMLVRYMMPGVAERLARPLSIVAGVLLAGGVLVLLAATLSTIYALAHLDTLAAMVAFVVIGLVTGHLLGGPDPEEASVLALASASRHPGIALAIASANFPAERFGGVVLLYLLVNAVVVIPYMKWRSARRTVATMA